MSYRLSGINPLAYVGVEPLTPPAMLVYPRSPTPGDSKGYNLGSLWLVAAPPPTTNWELWLLVDLTAGVATWVQIYPDSGAGVIRLDADVGFAIPTLGVINVLGGPNINTFGDASNNLFINLNESIRLPNTSSDGSQGVLFLGAVGGVGGQTFLHNYGTGNTFTGTLAGNLTLNVGAAQDNSGYGDGVLNSLTDGAFNTAAGSLSQRFVTTGNLNSSLGATSLLNLVSGSNNLALGEGSGENYTGAESSNIMIANPGVLGESNTIRIGVDGVGLGQQDAAYMAGVYGRSVGGTNQTVIIDNTGKLGSSSTVSNGVIITTFNANGTFIKNTNTKMIEIYVWNGGGGGGSGSVGINLLGANGTKGGSGSPSGNCLFYTSPASFFDPLGELVTVGASGIGGASVSSASPNTNGNNGTPGGASGIGNVLLPLQGVSNSGAGNTLTNLIGYGGQNIGQQNVSARNIIVGAAGAIGFGKEGGIGLVQRAVDVSPIGFINTIFNPIVGFNLLSYGSYICGTAGGGGAGPAGPSQVGASGGGIVSGQNSSVTILAAAAGGAAETDGSNGNSPGTTGAIIYGGGGGGGGGAGVTIRGGNGGNGATPGGGGGGGGAGINGVTNSGAGGNGGNGRVIVIEYL